MSKNNNSEKLLSIVRKNLKRKSKFRFEMINNRFKLNDEARKKGLRKIYGDYDYKIEERKLLSDQDTVEIKYIGRVEDMNVLSPLFREAFSDFLALKIAYALTGSNGVKDRMEQNFLASFKMARLRDSQEDTPDDISTGSWIEGRG